jgi:hypothetical protein
MSGAKPRRTRVRGLRRNRRRLHGAALPELLETRLLLTENFVFDAQEEGLTDVDLTLESDGTELQLRDAFGAIVKSQPLTENSGIVIIRGSIGSTAAPDGTG